MKKIIMAASLCLGAASLASAQDYVYMTGSTAARGIVFNTLKSTAVFDAIPTVTVYGTGGSGSASSATYMAFAGTINGNSTVIQCHWSGSEAGILDVASNSIVSEKFIDPSYINGLNNTTNQPGAFVFSPVDLAMADNGQATSFTPSPGLSNSVPVAVIPFTWVRNNGLWTGANVSWTQVRQALQNGPFSTTPRALFDGVTAHTNDFVYISGRDSQSGTRANALGLAITEWGSSFPVGQIEMNNAGVMQLVDGSYLGNFGFSSGGTLAATLGANTTSQTDANLGVTGYSVIAYLGRSDANTAVANGAVELTFNGVAATTDNIINGTYDFWGNEYLFAKNDASSLVQNIFGKLANTTTGINNFCDNVTAIKLTDMQSSRDNPDSVQFRKYSYYQ